MVLKRIWCSGNQLGGTMCINLFEKNFKLAGIYFQYRHEKRGHGNCIR